MITALDLFRIGIGPSSSHTVGPMQAAFTFGKLLAQEGTLSETKHVEVELYGSLGATGKGHGSNRAVVAGLEGHEPETVDPELLFRRWREVERDGTVRLAGSQNCHLKLVFSRTSLPAHPNGMRFTALSGSRSLLTERIFYSVGAGFIRAATDDGRFALEDFNVSVPRPFTTAAELLKHADAAKTPISGVVLANEGVWRPSFQTKEHLLRLWAVMKDSIVRGLATDGELPGGLHVQRRAPSLKRNLPETPELDRGSIRMLDWLHAFAIAVNEENAAGGRVVTAPTNGAAGVIPAVLMYHVIEHGDESLVPQFLLTAAAFGLIIKANSSLSGAEVGCQGEVGSASAMAAAGLTEVAGGTPRQVENAAEIALEHHLGLTCDPIGGLVQIPCIERNALGATKAISASRLALRASGAHRVSFDAVTKTMWRTGQDMNLKYKETSRGGLAVNVIEC